MSVAKAKFCKLLSAREIPFQLKQVLYFMPNACKDSCTSRQHLHADYNTHKQSFVTPLIKGIDLTLRRVTLISCANAINSN